MLLPHRRLVPCCFVWFVVGAAIGLPVCQAEEIAVPPGTPSLVPLLAKAKAGSTVVLPAGTFPGGLTLPPGVRLRGAGYAKTVLDAGTNAAGIAIKGGEGSRVEDLSIQTKGTAALVAEDARKIEVHRVRIRGGALGIQWSKVEGGRIENTVVADALVGLSFSHVRAADIVNCTFAGNASAALSLSDTQDMAVFNNVVADAGTAMVLNGERRGLVLDYNLYRALTAGKIDGQVSRATVPQWRDVTGGLDAHSLSRRVDFASADGGDFRPVSVLDWAPWRATTSDWGTVELAGRKAPATDIDGQARVGAHDVGAYEAPVLGAAKPDAEFRVSSDEGTKSAGVFRPAGTLVRYLFNDLPLKKGTYGILLPSRTQLGDAIEAGEYEIRVVESRLSWRYRHITGNAGVDSQRYNTDQDHVRLVRFAPDGSLLMANGWNERNENLRSRNLKTGQANWVFNGMSDTFGLCVADDIIYFLRAHDGKDTYSLARLDGRTGKLISWDDPKNGLQRLVNAGLNGMEELDGTLFLADTKNNKLYRASKDKPCFAEPIECPAPSQPAADRKRKMLWLLSGMDKLIALSPGGQRIAEFTSVGKPVGLAVAGDHLAVASAATGKIHVFDCTDPKQLRPVRTVGRGDGPYGPLLAERFHFQAGPYNEPRPVSLALDESGRIALKDVSGRVVVLSASGEGLYASIAQFGNQPTLAQFGDDERARILDHVGRFSWWIDAKAGQWQPDAYWGLPPNVGGGDTVMGYFADRGKKFGLFRANWREPSEKNPRPALLVVRFENYVGRPVLLYTSGTKGWVVRRDVNRDGLIDSKDGVGEPVLDTSGKPLTWPMIVRWMFAEPDGNGDFRTMTGIGPDGAGFIWKRKWLDAEGVPIYEFPPESLLRVKQPIIRSPYDFSQTEDVRGQSESRMTKDGRLLATFQFRHSPRGMALSNSGGTDLALFDRSGRMRWLRPLNDYTPIQGIKRMGDAFLSSWGHQCEWFGLDEDGLGLGRLGFPAEAQWTGMWVDHPGQYLTFTGNDGKVHVLVGDYMVNGTHWLTLDHAADYQKARFPFKLDAASARALAFRPVQPFELLGKSAAPKVIVRRLNAPLKIDGDPNKWRGITPQVLMLPVTASGAIHGPRDASAVVRLAYEGNNLYVQVLRFDDVVSFHQPVSKSHLQDTFEIMLNGFFDGFQWSVSNFTDASAGMVRRRFFYNKLQDLTPAEHAPRVIRVLDNSRDIPERKLIESVHGVDLAECKVIVTEFKLPIDKVSYRGSEEAIFPVRPGAKFWLGMMIDDNDAPGTDIQDVLVWPSSYGTFQPKEDGAVAIFE